MSTEIDIFGVFSGIVKKFCDDKLFKTIFSEHFSFYLMVCTLQSKVKEVEAAVECAIESGYRHFDCAWAYENEDEVGNAIKKKINEGKVKREDLFVVSKVKLKCIMF